VAESTGGNSWGLGNDKDKSKQTTSKPGWGSGFGSVAASVAESTGGNGWGAATGNDSANSAWFNKSANASSGDLLGGAGATDIQLQALTESGNPESGDLHSQPPLEETQVTESQEWDMLQDGLNNKEPLTVDVTALPEAETAGPTTGIDGPPEEGHGGDGGEGGEGAGEKVEEDEWAIPVKQKKKKGGASGNTTTAATPITPSASGGGGGDDWMAPAKGKKKGKKK
jgi:hypothetical protein